MMGFISQGDILPHCQVTHHIHFLVDFYDMAFPDGLVGILKGYLIPLQPYSAFIFLIDTVKDIQQGGFTGPVFPQERMYLTFCHTETDIF